ncbi:hypothetical protein BGW80DRAFT_1466334 [Lactifluus volemus]|nr:hypothetical protein BGW80DRAFT_1466334 [Lactifluus volemus]
MLIQIADLSATHYDLLARAVRQRLRALLSCSQRSSPPMPPSSDPSSADADADDHSSAPSPASSAHDYSIPMVYPSEIPSDDLTLLPLANSELPTGELAPLRDFHVDIFKLPMLGSLPALLDLNIATYVSRQLTGAARSTDRPLPVRHRKKLYEWMWKDLLRCESRIAGKHINSLPRASGFTTTRTEAPRVKVAKNGVKPGDPCNRIGGSQCVCNATGKPSLSRRLPTRKSRWRQLHPGAIYDAGWWTENTLRRRGRGPYENGLLN